MNTNKSFLGAIVLIVGVLNMGYVRQIDTISPTDRQKAYNLVCEAQESMQDDLMEMRLILNTIFLHIRGLDEVGPYQKEVNKEFERAYRAVEDMPILFKGNKAQTY